MTLIDIPISDAQVLQTICTCEVTTSTEKKLTDNGSGRHKSESIKKLIPN